MRRNNSGFSEPAGPACRAPRPPNKGFTLVELLVALCIFSIMSMAVYSALSGGIKAYKRVKSFAGTQTDALIALEKLERDLNNTFSITGIDFSGAPDKVSFPAASPITRVIYYFDSDTGVLMRGEQPYAGAIAKSDTKVIASNKLAPFKSMSFSFGDYNKDTKILTWKDSWTAGSALPCGVKIEAAFDSGGKTVKVKRIVFIPVAG